jgi:hypothetical protein
MTNIVPGSNNNHIVRLGTQRNPMIYAQGTTGPKRFDQLIDVNMIGVQDGDIVTYDEKTKTYVPISRNDYIPDEINLIYVSKNGNDENSGKSIQEAKLTIDAAVAISSESTVIRVSPGNYTINNPLTLPDQVSIIGQSLREVSITPQNQNDLFYVGNGNYIAEMSFVGSKTPYALVSFDPVGVRYIDQSPYVQNCTNFIPESIGMRINGKNAIGPIKSMVLDSYTQYNQAGVGVSITNSGYAQLVSLFTICNNIAVYCGSGGACDLTNSNSSFGNFALIADGISPLQYTGVVNQNRPINFDSFIIEFNNPTINISNAIYDNITGVLTAYTQTPHGFSVGMGITLTGLAFTCNSGPGILTYPSGNKGYTFNTLTVAPGRYIDSYNMIQLNREEIIETSFLSIGTEFPGFINPSPGKCKRDLGFIVDAISTDVRDYTNINSINLAKAYFDINGNLLDNGLQGEIQQTIFAFHTARDLMKLAITNNLTVKNLDLIPDPISGSNTSIDSCSNVKSFIDNLVGIVTTSLDNGNIDNTPNVSLASTVFSCYVGISTLAHTYHSGGSVKQNIIKPFDGQVIYFDRLYNSIKLIKIINSGDGYTTTPTITIDPPLVSWGIPASAVAEVVDGKIKNIELVSSGRGYTSLPKISISAPNVGINTAIIDVELEPTYYSIASSTEISSGICTVSLNDNIPYELGIGTNVYFYKQSRILASGHSLEYIGSGTDISKALPFVGGTPIQENETTSKNGGLVIYTSTDQSGNFRIGNGVVINQQTGSISGSAYTKSLFSVMAPFILAFGGE